MRNIKIGLGLLATLIFGIAMTASASAAGFLSSEKNKLLSTTLTAQIFNTENGEFECAEANIMNTEVFAGTEIQSQLALVEYEKCFSGRLLEPKLSLADFLLLANGSVALDKLLKFNAVLPACEMSFPAQTLSTVKYDNSGKNILVLLTVTGILYTASRGCNHSGIFKTGTYKGNFEMMTAFGTLSFMP